MENLEKRINDQANNNRSNHYLDQHSPLYNYLSQIQHNKPLSREEEIEITRRIRRGDPEAEKKLIEANLRFVVSVALDYTLDNDLLEELIAEGNAGMITAVRRFDETRGFKFITYAVWWIRQAMLKSMTDYRKTIDLPGNYFQDKNKIKKAINDLDLKYYMHIDPLSYIEEISAITNISEKRLAKFFKLSNKKSSLDRNFRDDEECLNLYEVLSDETQADSEDDMINTISKSGIEKILNKLPDVEARVLRLYYGLNENDRSYTLEGIGSQEGVTRERIRQIKVKALERLRQGKYKEILKQL